jgi:hypothetical protein
MLPKSNYKYIPLKYFPNLLFEFRLNPYAMFTSGGIGSSINTVNTASTRNFKINKFEIWADLYYFDEVTNAAIDA